MIVTLRNTIILSLIYAAIIFTMYPVQGFVANHIDYYVQENSDAIVTADYSMSWGEQIAIMVPTVKDQFANIIKSEYGDQASVISMSDTQAKFTIPKYGSTADTNKYLQTPCIDFNKIKSRANEYWFMKYMDIDYSPTITTITFYNGYSEKYNDVMFVPAVTLNK